MINPTIGRIASVDPRSIWAHEAHDFTPWLAQPENIAELANTLQLGELEVEATEQDVGRFSADIVARDESGNAVLIENQIESTDHRHLGQVLTYLAGLEGDATVIWIATKFLEEHRAAVDWLNANTSDRFDFFAVELEVLRIGNSDPAPRFNVVAKPNDWTRSVRATARQLGETATTDRQKMLLGYWSAFGAFLESRKSRFKIKRANKDMWFPFAIGRAGFHISVTASVEHQRIGVELYTQHVHSKEAFRLLEADKASIEKEFGEALDWQELPGKKATRIVVFRHGIAPADEASRQDQFAWLLSKMDKFQTVFAHRIKALDLEGEDTEGDTDAA